MVDGMMNDTLAQNAGHVWITQYLKVVDTIGNCQRLAFTVVVSQHMHKITNLWKFELNRSSKLRDNNERKKHPCHTKLCVFRWLISRPHQVLNLRSRNQIHGKLLLSRKLWQFRGSRFSQCLYHQPLPITCHQERFYANNYFEKLPIVSTALKLNGWAVNWPEAFSSTTGLFMMFIKGITWR